MARQKTKAPAAKAARPLLNTAKGKRGAPEPKPEIKAPFGGMPFPEFPATGPVSSLDDVPSVKSTRRSARRAKRLAEGPAADVAEGPAVRMPKAAIVETLQVPAALLLAGEAIASKADKQAHPLHGVLIHQVDNGRARVVARDGVRVFVASFPLGGKAPSWLKDGLFLARANLKARVTMLAKVEGALTVAVGYAAGTRDAELSDVSRSAVMKIDIGSVRSFPDYERAMTAASFSPMDYEGEIDKRDWQAVGFSSRSLKHCGEIAKILESGIDKENRPPEGMVIRAFNGHENAPKVFDYPQWPGALLIMQPVPAGQLAIPAETIAVLAPAVKLTVAALRAHAKRWIMRADASGDEAEKSAAMERAAGFQARVDALLVRTPGVKEDLPMLEGEASEPMPAVTDETVPDEAGEEDC